MNEKFGIALRSPTGRFLTWPARIAVMLQIRLLHYPAVAVAERFGISAASAGKLVRGIPAIIGEDIAPVLDAIEAHWCQSTGNPKGTPVYRVHQLDGLALAFNSPEWASASIMPRLTSRLGVQANRENSHAR